MRNPSITQYNRKLRQYGFTMQHAPYILLVNPWIHDFAAYDVWAKPLGLLVLAGILRDAGCRVSYIDCTDRFHPKTSVKDAFARNGRGPYLKEPLPKPAGLEDVQRIFCRYGIKPEWLDADLAALPKPDLVMVTSLMTYWYGGVSETIDHIRKAFPDVPVILGGIYASLCPEHAKSQSGADYVFTGAGEAQVLELVKRFTGVELEATFNADDLDSYPYPAFDLQHKIGYVPLLTSRGCPFRCSYCASHILEKRRLTRSPQNVTAEILYWHEKFGVCDFALYDDAFLVDFERHAGPLLKAIIALDRPLRFHTPNALHIREINAASADLMFRAGFDTLRLGLETVDFDKRGGMDNKVAAQEYSDAVTALLNAGFTRKQVGAYLLAGLPGQTTADVLRSVKIVQQSGITPIPSYYTPIPQTAMWVDACKNSRYNLEQDPVFTNNAVLPCSHADFTWDEVAKIKAAVAAG